MSDLRRFAYYVEIAFFVLNDPDILIVILDDDDSLYDLIGDCAKFFFIHFDTSKVDSNYFQKGAARQ